MVYWSHIISSVYCYISAKGLLTRNTGILKIIEENEVPTINISYKVPSANVSEVEDALQAHAGHMRASYTADNPRGDNPLDAYFTKAEELNNPTNPADGTTGNIIFTLNEKWSQVEHIQSHIGRTLEASHAEKFISAMQAYGTVSVMGEIFYDMNG